MPKKRVIRDWMGEDWTREIVSRDDPRLVGLQAKGLLIHRQRAIVIERQDDNSTLLTIFHEVAHKACPWMQDDEPVEELKIDTIALTFKQFLEKSGVDLSPLLK
jgi:hypothetical protein